MDGVFDGLTVTDFHDDAHRNQDLYDDLANSPAGRQAAIALEIDTKPHTYRSNAHVIPSLMGT